MTDRARNLRGAVAAAAGPGKVDKVLRTVVEEIGLRPGMTGHLEAGCCTCDDIERALGTLLEAAEDG